MMLRVLLALLLAGTILKSSAADDVEIRALAEPSPSPLITFRILFLTGAAYDAEGKEGVASLTAAMLAKGGTKSLAYEQIVERMYPMATSFEWQVDKEMTVFTGSTHIENLQKYYALIREMLLSPGFREDDFTRLKSDAINFLKVSLRDGNDEELAKEELYNQIYRGHPYGHHNMGRLSSLEKLTVEDVKAFYTSNYTRANLVIGVAGGYPQNFPEQIKRDFSVLPTGEANKTKFAAPATSPGRYVEIIQRETRSTAISFGFPIDVRRGNKDFPPLALASSWLGQHRSSNSHLYQRLREARGLNYGDYAYIEYFPRGMFQFEPDPNLGRQSEIFQIWIRPVPPEQGLFALRAGLYEFSNFVDAGLSEQAFESTREFLSKFVNILTQTQDESLGYKLDSLYYGIPEYTQYMKSSLAGLTRDEVNAAIKKYLKTSSLRIVIVTKEANALRDAILASKPSPITYNSPKPRDIVDEDKLIEKFPIDTKPEWVTVVPVENVFE
jgi:zinc protease